MEPRKWVLITFVGPRGHDVVPELGALAIAPGVGPLVGGHDALGHRLEKSQEMGFVGAHGRCLRRERSGPEPDGMTGPEAPQGEYYIPPI